MRLRRNLITVLIAFVYVVLMAYAFMTTAARVYENFQSDGMGLILTGAVVVALLAFFICAYFIKGRSVLERVQDEKAGLIIVESIVVVGLIGAAFFLNNGDGSGKGLWIAGMLAATFAVCRVLGGRLCGIFGLACQFALMMSLYQSTSASLLAEEFLNVFCLIVPFFIFIIFIRYVIPAFSGSVVMLVFADCLMGLVFAMAILFNPMAIWLALGCVLSLYQSFGKDAENPLTKGFMIGFMILVFTAVLVFVFSLVLGKNPTAIFNIQFNEMFNLSLSDGTIYDFCINKLSNALDAFLLSPYKYGVFPAILLLFGVVGGVFTGVRKSSSFAPMLFVMIGVIVSYISISPAGGHFYYMSLMISICAAYGFYNTIIPEKLVKEKDEAAETGDTNYYKGPQPRSDADINSAIAASHMSALDIVEDPSENVIAAKKSDPKKDVNVVNKEYIASFEDPRNNPNTTVGAKALQNEDTDEFQSPEGVVGGPRNAIEGASYGDEDSKLKVDNTGVGDEKNYIDFKNGEIGPEDINKIGYKGPRPDPKPMEQAVPKPQEIEYGDLFKADDVKVKPHENPVPPIEEEIKEPEPEPEPIHFPDADEKEEVDVKKNEPEEAVAETEETDEDVFEPEKTEEDVFEPEQTESNEDVFDRSKEEVSQETDEAEIDVTEDQAQESVEPERINDEQASQESTEEAEPNNNESQPDTKSESEEGDEEMSKNDKLILEGTNTDEKGFSSSAPRPVQKDTHDNRINGPLNTDPSHFMEWHVSEEFIREEEIAKMKQEKEAEKVAADLAAKEAAATVVAHSDEPDPSQMPGKGDIQSDKVDDFDKGVLGEENNLEYREYTENTMLDKTTTDESSTTIDIKGTIAEEDEEENINSKIYSGGIDDGERAIESTFVPEEDTVLGADAKKKQILTEDSSDKSDKPEDILTAIENTQVPEVEIPDINNKNEPVEEVDEELNNLLDRLDMSESIRRLKESAREDIADVIEQDEAEKETEDAEEEVVLSNTGYNFGTGEEEYGEVPTISDLEDKWRAEQQMQDVDEADIPDVVSADEMDESETTQDVNAGEDPFDLPAYNIYDDIDTGSDLDSLSTTDIVDTDMLSGTASNKQPEEENSLSGSNASEEIESQDSKAILSSDAGTEVAENDLVQSATFTDEAELEPDAMIGVTPAAEAPVNEDAGDSFSAFDFTSGSETDEATDDSDNLQALEEIEQLDEQSPIDDVKPIEELSPINDDLQTLDDIEQVEEDNPIDDVKSIDEMTFDETKDDESVSIDETTFDEMKDDESVSIDEMEFTADDVPEDEPEEVLTVDETEAPEEDAFESVETEAPVEVAFESVETEAPVEDAFESVEPEAPAEETMSIDDMEFTADDVPAEEPEETLTVDETETPVDDTFENVETEAPVEVAFESVETEAPVEDAFESVEAEAPVEDAMSIDDMDLAAENVQEEVLAVDETEAPAEETMSIDDMDLTADDVPAEEPEETLTVNETEATAQDTFESVETETSTDDLGYFGSDNDVSLGGLTSLEEIKPLGDDINDDEAASYDDTIRVFDSTNNEPAFSSMSDINTSFAGHAADEENYNYDPDNKYDYKSEPDDKYDYRSEPEAKFESKTDNNTGSYDEAGTDIEADQFSERKPEVDETMEPKITVSRVKNHVNESPVFGFTKKRESQADLAAELGIPKPSDEPEREPEVIDIRRRRRQRADIFDEEIHTENITRRTAGGMRSYHKIIIKKD